MNLLPFRSARTARSSLGGVAVALPAGRAAADGRRVVVGVRPEALELAADGIDAEVEVVEEIGADAFLFCAASSAAKRRSSSPAPARSPPERGRAGHAAPAGDEPHLFDAAKGATSSTRPPARTSHRPTHEAAGARRRVVVRVGVGGLDRSARGGSRTRCPARPRARPRARPSARQRRRGSRPRRAGGTAARSSSSPRTARAAGRRSCRYPRRARRGRRRRRPRSARRAARSAGRPRRRPAARPVARAGGGEDRARSKGGAERSRTPSPASRAASAEIARRTGRLLRPTPARQVELAGRAVAAAVELAAEDESDAETGADREEDEVVDAARHAVPLLAEGGEVNVVLERDRQAETLLELGAGARPSSPGKLRGRREPSGRRRRRRGRRRPRVDELRRGARRGDERVAQRGDGVDRRPRLGGGELDVLARADRAAPGRRSRRAGSARRGRGRGRGRLPEPARRRPRRSSGPRDRRRPRGREPASSSDWSASETVGLEMPARREISAREIGAPARIVSSTVRSFRCLSSGGIGRACRAIS